MSDEENAKQIICLTFIPVGTIVKTGDRRNRCSFISIRLDANARVVVDGEQVIDNLKAVTPCGVINASDVGNLSVLCSRMVLEEFEDGKDSRRWNINRQLVLPDRKLLNIFRKTRDKVSSVSV